MISQNTSYKVSRVITPVNPQLSLHFYFLRNFRTPGSALDGWAREELSASLAWQAVRHQGPWVKIRWEWSPQKVSLVRVILPIQVKDLFIS